MSNLPTLSQRLRHMAAVICIMSVMFLGVASNATENTSPQCPGFLNHDYRLLHSIDKINLCELYQQRPVLIVNTASHCGFTHQFSALEALYQKYRSEGLHIIGFASNDFKQEAKNEVKAANICFKKYGVTFTMIAPSHVKGKKTNPTFAYLNAQTQPPNWNFNKYLVTEGEIYHFESRVSPLDSRLEKAIVKNLNRQN